MDAPDNPDTGDIFDIFQHIRQRYLMPLAFQLFDNALRLFNTGFDMFDGSSLVNMDELLIENINLRGNLTERGVVEKHQGFPVVHLSQILFRKIHRFHKITSLSLKPAEWP